MDPIALIARLDRFPAALGAVVGGIPDADLRWKPPTGGWSILEVMRHLLDEETEDFRARLRDTIEDPARDWAPIDPERAATDRAYGAADPADTLRRLSAERASSVAWLRGLRGPDWDAAHVHPLAGSLRAGDLLTAWAAHDARHLAQVARLLHAMCARDGAPYSPAYAG